MDLSSKNTKKVLFYISFTLILMWALDNIGGLIAILTRILSVLSPFLVGIGIAFLFNRPMIFIEDKLFNKGILKKVKDSWKRPLSYSITLFLFLLLIFVFLFLVIPELVVTIEDLGERIPLYIDSLEELAQDKTPEDFSLVKRLEAVDWDGLKEKLIHIVKDSWKGWAGNTFSFVSTVIGKLVTFGLAFVFSAYALLEKEKLIVQIKKLVLAYLPRKSAERVFHIGDLSNEAFIGFISGKLRESLVIVVLFFITMKILKFPYALMISMLIAILTLIPWIGAFIGFGLGFLLILVVDTKMAFWFIILFVALYQIEGNLIYHFVVGKASNLSSIWIFVAGIIGGSVGGLAGILLSIPIFSVLYTLLNESINRRLKAKGIKKIE